MAGSPTQGSAPPAACYGRSANHQFAQGDLALAQQDVVDAALEVIRSVVGGIGAAGNDRTAALLGHLGHGEHCLAHAQQAHFAEVVKIVLVQHGIRG